MPMFTEQIDIEARYAHAEMLCRTLVPRDLGNTPLYIVPQSKILAEIGGNSVCEAFTSPGLDLYLKDVIGLA
jgi:hypothetical protein